MVALLAETFAFAADASALRTAYLAAPDATQSSAARRHTGIPSVAVAGNRLWVTYYGGPTGGEDSNNFCVLEMSEDRGATWRPVLVADPDGDGPKRAFDPEVWTAPDGRLFWTWTERTVPLQKDSTDANAGCKANSKNDALMGVAFDPAQMPSPESLVPQRFCRGVMMCKPIVLDDGTWLWPSAHWADAPSACFYESTDRGETFSLRGGVTLPEENRQFDEHAAVQLRNGDLLAFIRTIKGTGCRESRSHDRGRTWSVPKPARIAHTSSRLFLRKLRSGNFLLVKHGSLDKDVGRTDLTAYLSEDDGETWKGGLLVDARKDAAYPDGDQAPDGTIYLVHDHNRLGAQEVLISAFTEADVLAGRLVSDTSFLRRVVTRNPSSRASVVPFVGKPVTLVVPERMSAVDAFAAQDMNGLLARAAGRSLTVATNACEGSGVRIFFGIPPADFDRASLADQERCLIVRGNDIHVFGGGTNGNRYAAYDFLRRLGYRFYNAFGGMRVPRLEDVVLTNGVFRSRPSFAIRSMIRGGGRCTGVESALFAFRNGYNGPDGLMRVEKVPFVSDYETPGPWAHSVHVFLPQNPDQGKIPWINEMCGNLEKEHPEYFSKDRQGRPMFNHQRCVSEPGCRALFKRVFFEHLRRLGDRTCYVTLSAHDTPGRFCSCAGCVALEEKYGTPAGPLLDITLEIAPEVAAAYPKIRLLLDAYRKAQTQSPPRHLDRLPSNVYVRLAPIDDDFSKSWAHPKNARTFEDLTGWARLCDGRLLVWYYPNPYGEKVTPPMGNLVRMTTDIRLLHAQNIAGFDGEHNIGVGTKTGFAELQNYVFYRLMEDASQDADALIDDFLDYAYGAAAKGVRAYLNRLEELTPAIEGAFPWNAGLNQCTYLTKERLAKWEGVFDSLAAKVAGDERRRRNLARLRLGLDLAELRLAKDVSVVPRIRETVGEIERTCYSPRFAGLAADFRKATEHLIFVEEVQCGGVSKPLPADVFGGYAKEQLYVTMPESRAGGYVDDPRAAFGRAAYYNGNNRPETLALPLKSAVQVVNGKYTPDLARIEAKDLPPKDEYRFFFLGDYEIVPDALLFIGSYWLNAQVGGAYDEGSFNRVKFYASLRFEGPNYYPGDTRPNAIVCDRVVVVKLDFDQQNTNGKENRK